MELDSSPGVVRRLMAFGLAKLRDEAGLTQQDAARAMRCSHGRISNLEVRRNLPPLEFLEKLLRIYGRDDLVPHYTQLLDLAQKKSAWETRRTPMPFTGFDVYLGLEEGASRIDVFETRVIPGLLQTERYARALMHAVQFSDDGVDEGVELRMTRQHCITRDDNPAYLWVALDETALNRPVGDTDIHREQLRHLAVLCGRANVQVQVIPGNVLTHLGTAEPFITLRFPTEGDPGLVYVETLIRAVWFETDDEISRYTNLMNRIRAAALDPDASRKLIQQRAEA